MYTQTKSRSYIEVRKITVCAFCATFVGECKCKKTLAICTSVFHWVYIKKKYKWKILGRKRLIRHLMKYGNV